MEAVPSLLVFPFNLFVLDPFYFFLYFIFMFWLPSCISLKPLMTCHLHHLHVQDDFYFFFNFFPELNQVFSFFSGFFWGPFLSLLFDFWFKVVLHIINACLNIFNSLGPHLTVLFCFRVIQQGRNFNSCNMLILPFHIFVVTSYRLIQLYALHFVHL